MQYWPQCQYDPLTDHNDQLWWLDPSTPARCLRMQNQNCWNFLKTFFCQMFCWRISIASFATDRWSATCKQWFAWEQSGLQKKVIPAKCWTSSDKVSTGWLLLVWSPAVRPLIIIKSTSKRGFPLGFPWAKNWLAYLERGIAVIFPDIGIRARSKNKSPSKWLSVGRFCLHTAFSSFGVAFTLNSVFIPKSILPLAIMSWFLTKIKWNPVSVNSVPLQSNRS